MLRILLLLIVSALSSVELSAQKTQTVLITYTYRVPENMTLEQAKLTALERARMQAIADTYGTVIGVSNLTNIENIDGESNIKIRSFGGSEIRGEWIETLETPVYDISYQQDMLMITVTVKGRIREINNTPIGFKVTTHRNGFDEDDISTEFWDNDCLFVSFSSPVDGYLAIYQYDGKENVYCLLPYASQSDGHFSIKANRTYKLFSPDNADYGIQASDIDAYEMKCSGSDELNPLYIIFSPNSFTKVSDKIHDSDLPRVVNYMDFYNWLTKCRNLDKEMCVDVINIIIHPS